MRRLLLAAASCTAIAGASALPAQAADKAPLDANGMPCVDGKLDVSVSYRDPQRNAGFDPELLKLTVPQGVRILDFR